jgi:hypothetical protein
VISGHGPIVDSDSDGETRPGTGSEIVLRPLLVLVTARSGKTSEQSRWETKTVTRTGARMHGSHDRGGGPLPAATVIRGLRLSFQPELESGYGAVRDTTKNHTALEFRTIFR